MDRLTQLRGEAGSSKETSLNTSLQSEGYMTANESSKYFSLSEEDSSFDISSIKDVSLASAADPEKTITGTDQIMPNVSPIPKKSDLLDSFKFGKEIEAANILSGGVNIFDDNDNSYDGDELVIDDNVEIDEKSNSDMKLTETLPFQKGDEVSETMDSEHTIASKDTEVVLQIDGKNVNAIDIGNGLYLYRKEGEEELAAVQIVDDDQQQPSFKFLKVRENSEGNLEVYEEIEIEVPKEVPVKEGKTVSKSASHVPIKDINRVISEQTCNKVVERKIKIPQCDIPSTSTTETVADSTNSSQSDTKSDVNLNGKMVKFNETRKSPVIHSTPNKEGIPLTKTMVDLHLHPTRHSDKVKTIEVHTDSCKLKLVDTNTKCKDLNDDKTSDIVLIDTEKEESKDKTNNGSQAKSLEIKNPEEISLNIIKKADDSKVKKIQFADVESTSSNNKELISSTSLKLTPELVLNDKNEKSDFIKPDTEPSGVSLFIPGSDSKAEEKDQLKIVSPETKINPTENQDSNGSKDIEPNTTICAKDTDTSDIQRVDHNLRKDLEKPLRSKESKNTKEITSTDKAPELCQTAHIIGKAHDKTTGETSQNSPTEINHKVAMAINDNQRILTTQKPKIKGSNSTSSDIIQEQDKGVVTQIENNYPKKQEIKRDAGASNEENNVNMGKPNNDTKPDVTIHAVTSVMNESKPTSVGTTAGVSNKIELTKNEKNTNENTRDFVNVSKISDFEVKTKMSTTKKHENIHTKQLPHQKLEANSSIKHKEEGVKTEKYKESITSAKVEQATIKPMEPSKAMENIQNTTQRKTELKKELPTGSTKTEQKAINNNDAAVPFGKWTEVNRQDFLNKIKEAKVPTVSSNTKQLKQANDLNRRDVLKKIDSQRQSNNAMAKVQELNASHTHSVKPESKNFATKPTVNEGSKIPVKSEVSTLKNKPISLTKTSTKQEIVQKQADPPVSTSIINKKESTQRKEINNQDLIDKTIEGIINRTLPAKPNLEDTKQVAKDSVKNQNDTTNAQPKVSQSKGKPHNALDPIEMKMNELHGIPFVERPPHELPQVYNLDLKTYPKPENQKITSNKANKIPNLLPFPNKAQQKMVKDNIVEIDSEEEVIEHEPITGDIELGNKKSLISKASAINPVTETVVTHVSGDIPKKEAIITEKDFEKFVRRNSITCENRLNFEGKESHNVIQTVVEKDIPVKKYSRNEILLAEAKVKASQKHQALHSNKNSSKIQITSKVVPVNDDVYNKNYQSKLQIAYQSALTAKRRMEAPITIIEDKPVKVVFMDSNAEFVPQLNVQGQDLSPTKKIIAEPEAITVSTCDSLDSVTDATDDCKSQDESKSKTKHQRKQVLTPVDTPDLELIEPADIGIHVSPKKKRRTEDYKFDKTTKSLVPKKSYLLGRSNAIDDIEKATQEEEKNALKETINQKNVVSHNAASAIDNLVKAAELLETQSENFNVSANSASSDNSQQSTPMKRGRGRPRKYPLPDGAADKSKVQSPQKKPRPLDQKEAKRNSGTDEDTSDSEIIRENWTMGKINENILCPICNKLFRSENVVFKHVKHCTGPSPNRSDSDKRSTRRSRQSLESESKSRDSKSEEDLDIDSEKIVPIKNTPKKRRFRSVSSAEKDDVFLFEDVPLKERIEKRDEPKQHESRKAAAKTKIQLRTSNLTCEICGKTFRQLSYLVSHKLQHKKEEPAKISDDQRNLTSTTAVYSCEVCKKVFRKLHHLVQHRMIHNPSIIPSKSTRKSSSEQSDTKINKDQDSSKQNEDQSAAFRCEPCDKSFRKLHHLVEHRETHDGINKQKNNSTSITNAEKPISAPAPQCDVCKKTFRKLHHLIEHKEQHHETSSEKSDDKSVKSSLSTKDIIHECSLCYMVFPNEHSLNKHSVICQKKKRQSIAKQAKQLEEHEKIENITDNVEHTSKDIIDGLKPVTAENHNTEKVEQLEAKSTPQLREEIEDVTEITVKPLEKEIKVAEPKTVSNKREIERKYSLETKTDDSTSEIPAKIKKIEEKRDENIIKKLETPKKKIPVKDKVTPVVTKRKKSTNLPLSVANEEIVLSDASDDDEARYMLNPDFKVDDTSEGKVFMKVRAKKRNSLQIERPNSKDLVKRRTLLQHPPKIPRLKAKPIETKAKNSAPLSKSVARTSKLQSVPSTDSDDSDVKYSFPKYIVEKPVFESKTKENEKTPKGRKKLLVDKRKSLSGIAKRKSLGKVLITKNKEKSSPVKQIKRRTAEVEHRCDCGQLFSSAALLSRHTTMAHTPPRIRRRRSPPPENISIPVIKNTPRKSSVAERPKPTNSRKSSVKSEASNSAKPVLTSRKSTNKSEVKTPNKSEVKTPNKSEVKTPKRKTVKSVEKVESVKTSVTSRRNIAHRGVPVPEKMRKLVEKAKK